MQPRTIFVACSTDTTIRYTTIDDKPIGMHIINRFGANIISNTYENGIGKIVFDGNITTIPDYAFKNCVNLTNIIIPNNVTLIGKKAFKNCRSLTSITIPDSVASIGDFAFNDCSSLKNFYCKPTTPTTLGKDAFSDIPSSAKIYVPINRSMRINRLRIGTVMRR